MQGANKLSQICVHALLMACLLGLAVTTAASEREIDKQQAVAIAERQLDGRALKAFEHDDMFTVKVLTRDGRVRQIRIDKQSGQIIRQRPRP